MYYLYVIVIIILENHSYDDMNKTPVQIGKKLKNIISVLLRL